MNELVVVYGLTVLLFCVTGLLFVVYRAIQGRMIDKKTLELQAQAQKLSGQITKCTQLYPEMTQNASKIVGKGLGNIGIEGIMEELGIDPGLLKNPLVKGLIDKYAPRLIEKMAKGGNEQEGSGNNLL